MIVGLLLRNYKLLTKLAWMMHQEMNTLKLASDAGFKRQSTENQAMGGTSHVMDFYYFLHIDLFKQVFTHDNIKKIFSAPLVLFLVIAQF